MAAAANSSTFPHFPSLPPELRNQIWRDALPDKDGPALFFYRTGCWCPRRLSASDEGYDADAEPNLNLEFRHGLLDHVHVEVPLVFVNREARGIALEWVCEQGIEMRFREDRQCHVFARPFDLMQDALYVALDKWDEFCREPYERLFQPDLLEQAVSSGLSPTRIAVPEALLRSEAATLPEMFHWYLHVEVLFIVMDAQPDLRLEEDDMKVQRRWEVDSTQGRAFFWNDEHGAFDLGDGEYIGDEGLYRRIEEASRGLGEGLVENHMHSFEIRPIFAVRR